MSFDKPTRNRLAKFVADARRVIADEFTEQFQSLYGISAKGEVTPLDRLGHLDEAGLATAALLRERIDYLEKTHPDDKDGTRAAVARLAREQAFTILNRLAAIRMAEKRELIVESVGKGYQSRGFKVYETIAGSALGDAYHRYRRFLFCLFDELAIDLGILFDRRSPQALLFPREPALLALLDLLNGGDLEPLWAEDETIGWIYQYYNDPEERKKMRKESAAPRNSRELAVRNQFFTPRYVVEFLTDNTLGRIWYEMTRGQTRLADQCRYLVRRPTEIFLAEGETAPETSDQEGLSQEELLLQSVHIPHRPCKDPREIRLLDPACGSMHFGLYAFDLFETIYEEAWDRAERMKDEGRSMKDLESAFPEFSSFIIHTSSFPSKEAFLRQVPRLIIAHNIHGIDIDPRAVQIAGLSLWLRAQKAWQASGVKPADRPRVRHSNIVCAEPMPGSPEMLEEFVATLGPPLLGELVKTVFDKMQLAGEAGSLLKIEVEIRTAIDTARKEWLQQQDDLLTRKDGSQEEFFDTAEQQVIDALRAYAEQADADSYQRRLFADDAARGFAFIDLCRKRYDAVVMNPPFGEWSKRFKSQSKKLYPNSFNDILGAFIDRSLSCLHPAGLLGAITSRTCFFLSSFENWRSNVVLKYSSIKTVVDLGQGVMDDAMVEAAAYVLESSSAKTNASFLRAIADSDRQTALEQIVARYIRGIRDERLFIENQNTFSETQGSPFAYWIPRSVRNALSSFDTLEPTLADVRCGLSTNDNVRFARTIWEIPPQYHNICCKAKQTNSAAKNGKTREFIFCKGQGIWNPHVMAGASQPWFAPLTVVVNWKNDGAEIKAYARFLGNSPSRNVRSESYYFRPGISWTRRAVRMIPYVIPANSIPTASRYMAYPNADVEALALGYMASNISSAYLRMYGEKFEFPNFLVDNVKSLPVPKLSEESRERIEAAVYTEVERRRSVYQGHEPFQEFIIPFSIRNSPLETVNFDYLSLLGSRAESEIAIGFGLSQSDIDLLQKDLFEAVNAVRNEESEGENDDDAILDTGARAQKESNFSYCIGTAFGRWDIRFATGERQPPGLPDPFDPLPVCPPGMLQNAEGLPAEPKDVPADYPLRISWPGILVDDENHPEDIVARVREAIEVIWSGSAVSGSRAEAIEQEACEILGVKTLRDYFRRPAAFFADHLKRYSKSRRQAPIYWPLSTKSGSYTLWLYYHRLTDQTLHTCLADFLDPKIKKVQSELDGLVASGKDSTRAGELREFLDELKDLHDEIERVIKLPWRPNLNDGVLITASPLWKLFRLPKWQKDLKACWDKLAKGDYDWAHLAYTIWPSRVEKACEKDRSIAIAHGREDLCKVEAPKPKNKRAKKKGAEDGALDLNEEH